MALVFMAHSRQHAAVGQVTLRSFQRLGVRLLIDRQHHRVFGRVQINSDPLKAPDAVSTTIGILTQFRFTPSAGAGGWPLS